MEIPIISTDLESQVKKSSSAATNGAAVTDVFGDYNLKDLQVPPEAWPLENGTYKGTKSYTVRSRSGAAPYLNFLKGPQVHLYK